MRCTNIPMVIQPKSNGGITNTAATQIKLKQLSEIHMCPHCKICLRMNQSLPSSVPLLSLHCSQPNSFHSFSRFCTHFMKRCTKAVLPFMRNLTSQKTINTVAGWRLDQRFEKLFFLSQNIPYRDFLWNSIALSYKLINWHMDTYHAYEIVSLARVRLDIIR